MCNPELIILAGILLSFGIVYLVAYFTTRVNKKNYKKISHPVVKEHCNWCGARCEVYKEVHSYSDDGKPFYRVAKLCPNYGMNNTWHENMDTVAYCNSLEELLEKYKERSYEF